MFRIVAILAGFLASSSPFVDLHWSEPKIVSSPYGTWSVEVTSANRNEAANLYLLKHGERVQNLGHLVRDARVLWSADESYLIFNDLRYADHFFVKIVSLKSSVVSRDLNTILRRRIEGKGGRGAKLLRFEPLAEGFTRHNQVCIKVAATSVIPKANKPSPTATTEQYLIINPATADIQELSSKDYEHRCGLVDQMK